MKYAVEILKRFKMEDCKPIDTLMVSNLKNIDSSYSELVAPRVYKELI